MHQLVSITLSSSWNRINTRTDPISCVRVDYAIYTLLKSQVSLVSSFLLREEFA